MCTNKSFKHLVIILLAAMMITSVLWGCSKKENSSPLKTTPKEECTEFVFDNPIDEIINSNEVDTRFDEVYKFLVSHPDFATNSKSIGYRTFQNEPYYLIWKDCGNIRIYSIPLETNYSTFFRNIIQFKDNGDIDTLSLQNILGELIGLYEIKSQTGKTYYLLKTELEVCHQGIVHWENISAFSVNNGKLVKEKLFHTNNGQYDHIELQCGGQRWCPLLFGEVSLIDVDELEGDYPVITVEVVNEKDWPTGYGLKYEWAGDFFEYVGKCDYDADGEK